MPPFPVMSCLAQEQVEQDGSGHRQEDRQADHHQAACGPSDGTDLDVTESHSGDSSVVWEGLDAYTPATRLIVVQSFPFDRAPATLWARKSHHAHLVQAPVDRTLDGTAESKARGAPAS